MYKIKAVISGAEVRFEIENNNLKIVAWPSNAILSCRDTTQFISLITTLAEYMANSAVEKFEVEEE